MTPTECNRASSPMSGPGDGARRPYTEEPVGEREAGFDCTLAQDAVAFVAEAPSQESGVGSSSLCICERLPSRAGRTASHPR